MGPPNDTTEKSGEVDADPATSIDQSDEDDEKVGGFIFGNGLESNGADATLPEREQERVVDLVRLQPTKNAELQDRWGLNNGSEVHQYLESELKDYYYRDNDGYIRATDAAEEFAQNHQDLYQDVTRPEDEPEEEHPDLRRRDLVIALVMLTQELGHLPSAEEINDHGEYAHQRYREEFGDLYTAYQEAGILPDDVTRADFYGEEAAAAPDPESENEVEERDSRPNPELGAETESESVEGEGTEGDELEPRKSEIEKNEPEEIEVSVENVDRPDFDAPEDFGKDSLVSEIQRFANILDEPPTEELVAAYGVFPADAYREAFGSWDTVLETVGCDPSDVPDWSRRSHTNADILDWLRAVADELGRAPTTTETGKIVDFSPGLASLRFGSWAAALETAGLDPSERPSVQPDDTGKGQQEQDSSETEVEAEDNDDDDPIGSLIDETLEDMLLSDDDDEPI
jgi:hypothetical protein